METPLYAPPDIKIVASRPVKARAMQLLYRESTDDTLRHIRQLEACLGVRIGCANDQGALFCHLETDRDSRPSQIVSHTDWIVVDSFGKVSVVKDSEFKVYYQLE